ncbi:enoyl-CoA hydratase/isomerase family protein [Glaciecola sp. 2405UD65-10]|uniref:enoyl-CoA hydratase/isomerase family protein n=1 Tax=Glaciecola sp. 2405UD65-10 TaxID=3397244 RepID=UPI003B5C2DE5
MSDVILSIEGALARVTLNRPDVHNAFNEDVINSLIDCFERVAIDDNIRVMVLQSSGKSFSAGADLNWMKKMASYSEAENMADAQRLALMLNKLYNLPKPTIARVQGAAYGGAVGLIACCDIVIASRLSKYCLSEVKLGLIPATISPYLVKAIGPRNAKHLFMTAQVFSARRARRIGLISEAVSEDELDSQIEDVISAILKNGPYAVAQAKALVDEVENQEIDEKLMCLTSKHIAKIRVSEEGQEGLKAFLDKRPANWVDSYD